LQLDGKRSLSKQSGYAARLASVPIISFDYEKAPLLAGLKVES